MDNKKTISYSWKLLVVIVCAVALISSGTYAYWRWVSDTDKDVVFNTINGLEDYIVYDAGESHFVGNFQPYYYFCQSINTTLSFKKKENVADIKFVATIHMDVNYIGENIAASDDVYWIVTKGTNDISCSTNGLDSSSVINYGTFKDVNAANGTTFAMTSNTVIEVTTEEQFFTVWIWIDENSSNLSSLEGETVDTNIWTQIDMLDNMNSGKENAIGEAYAVYSAEDSSLRFYRSETPIEVGDTYKGRPVTAVYTGFEDESYEDETFIPWYSVLPSVSSIIVEDYIYPLSTAYWFEDSANCSNINLSKLNVYKVTDMSNMFYRLGSEVSSLIVTGLDTWDVSNVTNMVSMFEYAGHEATTINIGDISGWNTSNVEDMSYMFYNVSNLYLDLRSWNVSNVVNHSNFNDGVEDKIIPPIWDGSAVYTISYDANGGSGGPGTITVADVETCVIPTITPTHNTYNFIGWYTSVDGTGDLYLPGDACPTTTTNLTLYADYGVNSLRYTCEYYANYNRLSTYFVTKCTDGVCTYIEKHGLDNTYSFTYDYSGIPTWSINESDLCTSTDCGNCTSTFNLYVGAANVGCYSGTSKNTPVITTFGTGKCSHLLKGLSITPYRTYDNGSVYVWYYYPAKSCYLYRGDLETTGCEGGTSVEPDTSLTITGTCECRLGSLGVSSFECDEMGFTTVTECSNFCSSVGATATSTCSAS